MLTDLRGYLALGLHCLRRAPLIRHQPYAERFLRQFVEAGKLGFAEIGLRSIGLGTLVIAYIVSTFAADPAAAMQILVIVVMREAGPLVAALIVMIRVGAVTTARLGLMQGRGEMRVIALSGLSPIDYLVLPAVFAIGLATMLLTFYFQLIAVGGGMVLSSLLMDISLRVMAENLVLLMSPVDIAYTAIKGFAFGAIIAMVSSHHGTRVAATRSGELPQVLSASIMQSLAMMLLFNAVFGYLVYGVLLFGIVRAQY